MWRGEGFLVLYDIPDNMGLLNSIKSLFKWETVASLTVVEVHDHGYNTVELDYYDAEVQEHTDTGERRVKKIKDRGGQVEHETKPAGIPNALEGVNGFGVNEVMYRRKYVEEKYGVE